MLVPINALLLDTPNVGTSATTEAPEPRPLVDVSKEDGSKSVFLVTVLPDVIDVPNPNETDDAGTSTAVVGTAGVPFDIDTGNDDSGGCVDSVDDVTEDVNESEGTVGDEAYAVLPDDVTDDENVDKDDLVGGATCTESADDVKGGKNKDDDDIVGETTGVRSTDEATDVKVDEVDDVAGTLRVDLW